MVCGLVACGGATVPAGQPTTPPDQTSAPQTTAQPPAPEATVTGGNGQPAVADPCAYLTTDEVAGTSRIPADQQITSTPTIGDPADCSYFADSDTLVQVAFQREHGPDGYANTVESSTSDEPVSEVGDDAVYYPDGEVIFMVGDLFVALRARYAGNTQTHEDSRAGTIALAKIIAGRLVGASLPPELQITPPPIVNAGTACDLLSADEAASVLNKGAMTATAQESVPTFCSYSVASSQEVLASTYFKPTDGIAFYADLEGSLTTDPVTALGDNAMFEPDTGILYVLKNDSMFNANVYEADPQDALEPDQQLAEIMLTHL